MYIITGYEWIFVLNCMQFVDQNSNVTYSYACTGLNMCVYQLNKWNPGILLIYYKFVFKQNYWITYTK